MRKRQSNAQTFIEYAILLALLTAALLTARVYMLRGVQEKFRQGVDVFGGGEQYQRGRTTVTERIISGNFSTEDYVPAPDACSYAFARVAYLGEQITRLGGYINLAQESSDRLNKQANITGNYAPGDINRSIDPKADLLKLADEHAAKAVSSRDEAYAKERVLKEAADLIQNNLIERRAGSYGKYIYIRVGALVMIVAALRGHGELYKADAETSHSQLHGEADELRGAASSSTEYGRNPVNYLHLVLTTNPQFLLDEASRYDALADSTYAGFMAKSDYLAVAAADIESWIKGRPNNQNYYLGLHRYYYYGWCYGDEKYHFLLTLQGALREYARLRHVQGDDLYNYYNNQASQCRAAANNVAFNSQTFNIPDSTNSIVENLRSTAGNFTGQGGLTDQTRDQITAYTKEIEQLMKDKASCFSK
ncbi:MAG: hypothetical protein WC628_00740 [Candidatus Omnitrophota bacterium]